MTFEEYVLARGSALLRLAYVLTRDAHAAEDLTQAALADSWRHWRRVERAGDPDAYVRKILVNRHLSQRRRRWWREQPVEPASTLLHPSGHPTDPTADPVGMLTSDEATREILDTLPPRARTILVLRYYLDLDDTAIANQLGLSASTVRATASRALATLRTALIPVTTSEDEQ